MVLIPLKLAAALKPADIQRSIAIATAPAAPAPISLPIRHDLPISVPQRKNLESKSPRSILRIKTMSHTTTLPYGDEEWRKLLDEVKELFQKGFYKKCSDRCVAALEQVRGPVHPSHLTYLSFYSAICISIQAQPLQAKNPQKLVLLKLSLSFYERAEGFLMQAKAQQTTADDRPAQRDHKRWNSVSSTQNNRFSTLSTTSTVATAILDPPSSSNAPDGIFLGHKASVVLYQNKNSSVDSSISERPARRDYKNSLYNARSQNTASPNLATPESPPRRQFKRTGSDISERSNSSSIDGSVFSTPGETDSRRSSASSFTSTSSATTSDTGGSKTSQPIAIAPIRSFKPPGPPRSRKRVLFAPSLPTIISDSCIASSTAVFQDNPSNVSPFLPSIPEPPEPTPPPQPPRRPLPPFPLHLRPCLAPISHNIQTPNKRLSSSPALPSPPTPCPSPTAILLRRPLPPLPLRIRPQQPHPVAPLNFSKPRPAPPPAPRPITADEAISLFLLSQSRTRYTDAIHAVLTRIRHHVVSVRREIGAVQFLKSEVQREERMGRVEVRTISVRELREGRGLAAGVRWKVEREEIVWRVRRCRVGVLKRRGEGWRRWEGGRYEELCRVALEELGETEGGVV